MGSYQFREGFLIPGCIAQAFEGRTSLTLAEAADAMEMDKRHLPEAADKGRVHYLMLTHARSRKMRRFLLSDVIDLLNAERRLDCLLARGRTRQAAG